MIQIELTGETIVEVVEKMLMMLNGISEPPKREVTGNVPRETTGDSGPEMGK